jgi:tetratricopeptide (TPR) repeat protein
VLGQSLTDWLWLIPTITGLGLMALALAAAPADAEVVEARPRPAASSAARARVARFAPAALFAAAAVSVALLFLSDLYVREARSQQGRSAEQQLSAAQTAEDLNPVSVTPLYLQASALESMGDRDAARDTLKEALAQEPDNFVTLALLGDLEVRAGELEDAGDYYRRASKLNPLDVGLQKLAETGQR